MDQPLKCDKLVDAGAGQICGSPGHRSPYTRGGLL